MTTRRRTRPPTTPGEILHEEFLLPLGMTQKQLADHVGCDVKVINRIVNGRSAVTPVMALKLGAARAIAVDHDPQAILATRSNADNNQVADRLEAKLVDEFEQQQGTTVKITFTNLTAAKED